jgi:hypothetical protein
VRPGAAEQAKPLCPFCVELHAVMLFVLVTSLLNIGLGYALAIYLGHGRLPWTGDEPSVLEEDEVDDLIATEPPVVPSIPAPSPAPSVAEVQAPLEAILASPPTPGEDAADVEQEVLAGIEEFRSQLAQMKAQPSAEEPQQESVAAATRA